MQGLLSRLEDELTDYFTTLPDGVYLNVIENSYERLLLHGVAQFLLLHSKSNQEFIGLRIVGFYSMLVFIVLGYKGTNGTRETMVENRLPYFIAPNQTLSDYLSTIRPQRPA